MAIASKKIVRGRIAAYGNYVAGLQRLAVEPCTGPNWDERALAALNGQASVELRAVVSLKTRRQFGTFFTGSKLAAKFITHATPLNATAVIHDSSMGMGDLLLAAASKLQLGKTLHQTLKQWGRQLSGTDLHPEFVRGAKTRLVLLARQRHGIKSPGVSSVAGLFPKLRVANGLHGCAAYAKATHLFLNPPFGIVDAPAGCKWAGGQITAAAMFIVTALERAKPDTELLAILPDVVRSGSFTAQWRQRIEALADVKLVEPYGIFDETADVDVFILRAVRRAADVPLTLYPWTTNTDEATTTIADFFDVHVGRVVPHRDPEKGESHPYIHARCVPTWAVMRKFSEHRQHEGKIYQAPFVVIRRTSRPGHPYRATATVIAGKQKVAVENHLIVCEPMDKTLRSCLKLKAQLMTKAVNKYLDARIRCRHLTVGSVAAIPFNP